LPARFPLVAAALADGATGERHAAAICRTVDGLPEAAAEHAEAVEAALVGHARTLNPEQLAVLARTVTACLDPDGSLAAETDQARQRSSDFAPRSPRATRSSTAQ
jgi:Domain of unknown function (DUF222)